VYVQVIGEHPEHAEHAAPGEKVRGGEPAVAEIAHALAEYVRGRLVVGAAQLAEEVQREEQHRPVRAKPRGEKRRVVRHQLNRHLHTLNRRTRDNRTGLRKSARVSGGF